MSTMPGCRVLLVEDDALDVILLRTMFSKEMPGKFWLTQVGRMHEAEAYLAREDIDVILLDLGLPDVRGLETLRRARVAAPQTAIIVLSGLEDESLANAALKGGAQDYLIKGQVESRALPRVLRHTIEFQQRMMKIQAAREEQLQLRDDFLSHVSHELRGPLSSICSFTSILADGLAGKMTAQQDEYLQCIGGNAQQLQAMIEELLEMTQVRAVRLGVADLPAPVVKRASGC